MTPRNNWLLEDFMKTRFYDRRWGVCLTAMAFIMCAASAFAATPDNPTNSANGVSEVTATCDEVVASAASDATAPTLGRAGNTDSPPAVPDNRILMYTAPDDTGGHSEAATLFMWADNAAGTTFLLFTEVTANAGGSTDAGFATSTKASDHAGMPNHWVDNVPHRTAEETFRGVARGQAASTYTGHLPDNDDSP